MLVAAVQHRLDVEHAVRLAEDVLRDHRERLARQGREQGLRLRQRAAQSRQALAHCARHQSRHLAVHLRLHRRPHECAPRVRQP